MKFNSLFILFILSLLTYSCDENSVSDMGVGIQPTEDKISIFTDTVHLSSENYFIDYFIARPDSFLLGTYFDNKFGTIQADIFAQLEPPLDTRLPAGFVADSAKINMYYSSWFGYEYSPMEVSIYQMNKGTFEYTKPYMSNLNPSDYCDKSMMIGKRIFSPKDAVIERDDATRVTFNLNNDFIKRMTTVLSTPYTSSKNFLNVFNGLYITTNFGTASMLYINQIDLVYYYHYKYANANGDSTTVNLSVIFPANGTVRQVNRVVHPDKVEFEQKLNATSELTYISSPANVYTRVNIPLKKLKEHMNVNGKMLSINYATVKFYIEDFKTDTVDRKLAANLLLIKESEFVNFFNDKDLPSDTTAILTSYTSEIDNNGDTNYYYSVDLAPMIANSFNSGTELPDNLSLLLVPVSVSYDSSSNIEEVKQQNLINSVTLCSGKHTTKPLNIRIVYSGL